MKRYEDCVCFRDPTQRPCTICAGNGSVPTTPPIGSTVLIGAAPGTPVMVMATVGPRRGKIQVQGWAFPLLSSRPHGPMDNSKPELEFAKREGPGQPGGDEWWWA